MVLCISVIVCVWGGANKNSSRTANSSLFAAQPGPPNTLARHSRHQNTEVPSF